MNVATAVIVLGVEAYSNGYLGDSWVDDVVAKPLRSDMVDHVVPGALRWYDLSDLEFTLKDRLWK